MNRLHKDLSRALPYISSLLFILFMTSCTQNTATNPSVQNVTLDSLSVTQLFARTKTNKDSGDIYIRQASEIVKANYSVKLQAIYWSLLGKEMIYSSRLDSANSIADRGLQLKYADKEFQFKGKFYNIKGNVAGLKKNIYQSIEYYLYAEKIFEQINDSAALAGIYSNIANSYFSLKDYLSAHHYAAKAYRLLTGVREAHIASNIITTYALSLNKTGRNREALPVVRRADSLADATQNKMAKIAATIGLAEVYNTNRAYDSAALYYNKAMVQSVALGIKHFELMSRMGLLAMYEAQGKTTEIINLSGLTIALAHQIQNADVLHTAQRITGKALGKQGQYAKGFQLLSDAYTLYDSVAGVENQENINELLVKYDTEKKEKEILNQNLLLAEQKTQLRNRQIVILGLALGLIILFIVYVYVRKLNRERLMRLEIEKQKKIGDAYIHGEQKERTRLAFEIHDGISGMLTGISYKLRAENANKDEVIRLLSALHEDTRRISHSLMPIDFERKTLVEAVQHLCDKINTAEIEVLFSSDKKRLDLDTRQSLLLYRIIQELMNNALKYARCKSIFVRIESNHRKVHICVEDDGVGMPQSLIENGLTSIKERIKSLNATMTIDSVIQEGTTVKISHTYA